MPDKNQHQTSFESKQYVQKCLVLLLLHFMHQKVHLLLFYYCPDNA